jgi:hypothetical protein
MRVCLYLLDLPDLPDDFGFARLLACGAAGERSRTFYDLTLYLA